MSFPHAVVWTDHREATILSFNAEQVEAHHVHAHPHATAQHASGVRTEHEFFAAVCAALEGPQILVTAGHVALADFRHYVEKHRPQTAARIIGYEVVDHPSDKQLVALARTCFDRHEQLAKPELHKAP
jgi:hypothetical protein